MATLSALRSQPHFAPLFARVFVFCWPILVWQINRFYTWALREGLTDALYSVNCWGFLKVHYLGDCPAPAAYKPLPRTFRPLTDASYASDVPANLVSREALEIASILPCTAGEVAAKRPEGALTSIPNTS